MVDGPKSDSAKIAGALAFPARQITREFLEAELTADSPSEAHKTQSSTQTIRHHPDGAVDAMLPMAKAVWEGEGDYLLQRLVGRGGTGVIQLATQRAMGRTVALKRLAEPKDARAARAILREVRIAGRLQHPGIVPMYGVFEDPEFGPIVAMPYISGSTWRSSIPRRRVCPLEQIATHVRVAIELSHALEYAHARGVLHLDVKPENVMLGDYGEVFLLDWGVACDPEFEQQRTRVLGTPAYMAPEMVRPRSAPVDGRSDVYLLGASLYEALLGKPPHPGDTPLDAMVMAFEPVCFPPTGLPSELVSICQRALALDPADRYESMNDFRDALERFLRHEDSERLARLATVKLAAILDPTTSHPDPSERVVSLEPLVVDLNAALALWPENPEALKTRGELRTALAETHIACGDLRAARRVARTLEDNGGILEAIRKKESTRAAQQRAHDDARRLEQLRAFKVNERHWKRAAAVLIGFFFLQGVATIALQVGNQPPSPRALVGLAAVALMVWIGAIVRWRSSFFLTYANSAASHAVTTAFLVVLLNRIVSMTAGLDSIPILRTDMLLIGGIFASQVALHRGFLGIGAICLSSAAVSAVWPETSRITIKLMPIVVGVWLYLMWAHLSILARDEEAA